MLIKSSNYGLENSLTLTKTCRHKIRRIFVQPTLGVRTYPPTSERQTNGRQILSYFFGQLHHESKTSICYTFCTHEIGNPISTDVLFQEQNPRYYWRKIPETEVRENTKPYSLYLWYQNA